ncbi:MAG: DUF4342 domain-containing protein [Nitrososphaeraceae archaeon]|nr:DUF4342 domain-containing protein [Nitrososphaeraceae archaeon]
MSNEDLVCMMTSISSSYLQIGISKDLKTSSQGIFKISMAKCMDCGTELSQDARYCSNCGTQLGLNRDVYDVSAGSLVGKFKEIIQDARVKRIVIKDEKGNLLLSIPVTWGTAGAVAVLTLAPWLAALGVIAGIVTKCKIEVEKSKEG